MKRESIRDFRGLVTALDPTDKPGSAASDLLDVGRSENFGDTETFGALCKRPGYSPVDEWSRPARINGILYFESDFCVPILLVCSHSTASAANCTVARLWPNLLWLCPTDADNDPLHFQFQLSAESDFTSTILDKFSSTSQTGFDYWNGSAWAVIPSGGVTSTYYGNYVRYVLQPADYLDGVRLGDVYYWRVRAHDGTEYGDWSATYEVVM